MKEKLLKTVICLGTILPVLFVGGCNKKGTHSPREPGESAFYLMVDYFPLDYGDSWTWEVVAYEVQEEFVDGDSSWGEPFTDLNGNGLRDQDEPYEDVNFNGAYDGPFDPWLPGTPYTDRNSNGEYDAPNSVWNFGELFLDLDDNGVCNKADKLTFYASILYPNPQDHVMIRGGQFPGTYSDGKPGAMSGDEDGFSNDSLGLRWHGHTDRTSRWDVLAQGKPITIARDTVELGDSVLTVDDPHGYGSWLSILDGVEDVDVPAGEFMKCLRFKSVALGWSHNMEKYEGVSYQWYAKDVGLVMSTGPAKSQYWILKSASVRGTDYP